MDESNKGSELPPTISGPGDGVSRDDGRVPRIEGYEITGRLGQGGMGVVWRAVQLGTHREVALKLLPAADFATEKLRRRFEREVDLAASLEHPNIARVYDSGLHHGDYYYAMQLIDGLSLDAYVRVHQLPRRDILELMRTVCEAVQHAHQHGVIHRDLKPSNILVGKDGQPCVLDFGLAKVSLGEDHGQTLSSEGGILGTPAYMSPEQAAGRVREVDTRSDVYSLGVILFRLIVGMTPHDLRGTRYEVLRRVAEEEVRRPREVGRFIDRDLDALLLKALARDPKNRYATAGELAEDIDNYLKKEPLAARKHTATYFVLKRMRKHWLPVTLTAAVLLSLGGLAVWSYVRIARERTRAVSAERNVASSLERAVAGEKTAKESERVAVEEAEAARRALYFNRIALAFAAYRQANTATVRELLALCPRDLRGWEWYYLRHIHDRSLMTLQGHKSWVSSVTFSPDGQRIASASYDHTVRIWDAATGRELKVLPVAQGAYIMSVAWSPDGNRIGTVDYRQRVKFWDARTGEMLTSVQLEPPDMSTYSIAFSPDSKQLAVGCGDKTVRILDAATGVELRRLTGHPDVVQSVAFSRDGKRIASAGGGYPGTLKIWDAQTGEEVMTVAHPGCTSVAFNRTGSRLATAGYDLRIWDAQTGALLQTIYAHEGSVNSVCFNPAWDLLASASEDGTVRTWTEGTPRERNRLQGHSGAVRSVAFSPDGKRIVSGGTDGTVKVWETDVAAERTTLPGGSKFCVFFSRDGAQVASPEYGAGVRLLSVDGQLLKTLGAPKTADRVAAFSPDGTRLAVAQVDGSIAVLDAVTGDLVVKLTGLSDTVVVCIAFSPDGQQVAGVCRDSVARVWDARTGKEIKALEHPNAFGGIAYRGDGKRLVTKTSYGVWRIWDTESWTQMAEGGERYESPGSAGAWIPRSPAIFSPDGSRLVTGDRDGNIRIWDPDANRLLMTLRGHQGWIYSVAFSPDGTRLVSASLDGTVKLWTAETGAEILTLRVAQGNAFDASFSPDGKRLVVGSWEGVFLYDSGPWDDDVPAGASAATKGAP